MKLMVQIRADIPNSYTKKSGDKVQERLLTCIDLSPEVFIADTFEVLATNLPFSGAGALVGKQAEIQVSKLIARNNGVRLQADVFPSGK